LFKVSFRNAQYQYLKHLAFQLQDWPYMTYNTHHQQQQQQQQQLGYLSQLDSCAHQLGLDQQRIYKNGLNGVENGGGGGLLSPVDSGIGQEMLLEQAKQVQPDTWSNMLMDGDD
jgi:hypothetical protein